MFHSTNIRYGMTLALVSFSLTMSATKVKCDQASRKVAGRIFERLAGASLSESDPRWSSLEQMASEGRYKDIAAVATADRSFYNVTITNWAAKISSREESTFTPLNDLQALIVGVVRDGIDARLLLTGDFRYQGKANLPIQNFTNSSNVHYDDLGRLQLNLQDSLEKVSPQGSYDGEAAGALTTRAWGESFYQGGTNRRAVDFAMREFLCVPITQWRDPGLSERMIRRDVDRAPGGDFSTFQNVCRTCHAPMDALAGAFAKIDYVAGSLRYYHAGVAPKYNQNSNVYPEGPETQDDSWFNQLIYRHNQDLGWHGALSGSGVRAFGQMLADSDQFKRCMVTRTIREVCRKEPSAFDPAVPAALAASFQSSGYNLKTLFQETAIKESCLDLRGSPEPALMNHRQLYNSLAARTGIDPADPTLRTLLDGEKTLLPEHGVPSEVSNPTLFATSSLASFFCRRLINKDALISDASQRTAHRGIDFAKGPSDLTTAKVAALADEYAKLFNHRDPLSSEVSVLQTLVQDSFVGRPDTPAETKEILTLACAAMGGSFESITY